MRALTQKSAAPERRPLDCMVSPHGKKLMRLRASELRELADKMRVVLAYDPAMTIRANEVACAADAIDEWAKGLR